MPSESARSSIEAEPAREPSGQHLSPDDVFDLIEERLSRRKAKSVEAHLDACAECVETLAVVLRADRPASREEQGALAQLPLDTDDALLEKLRPHLERSDRQSASRVEWKPIAVATAVAMFLAASGLLVHERYWLPATSRRAASETLRALVEMRQATGRLPLRYITEFERAGVVRSGFDDTATEEHAMLENLKAVVDRAPVPEAMVVLGLLLLDEGKLDQAEAYLTRARESLPASVDVLNGLAVIRYERAAESSDEAYAHLQEGLSLLRKAEGIDPDDLRVSYNYAKFYDALNMRAAAAKSRQRYLRKDAASQWAEEAAFQLSR